MIPYVDADNDGSVDGYTSIQAFLGQAILNFNGPPTLVLPVELLYFRAQPKGAEVLLEWATSAELNNDYFELQRSVDGRSYEALTQVRGAGTHEGLLRYEQVDERPLPGLNYYRLKQVDFDGSFEYSNVVSIQAEGKAGGMNVFPNPAFEYVELGLPAAWQESRQIELTLRDVSGRVLRQWRYALLDGPLQLPVHDLAPGYYLLEAHNGREVLSEKLVITR
jgi:hypothetical protein